MRRRTGSLGAPAARGAVRLDVPAARGRRRRDHVRRRNARLHDRRHERGSGRRGGLAVTLAPRPAPPGATQTTAAPRVRRFRLAPSGIAASLVAHQHSADTRRLLPSRGLVLAVTAVIAGGARVARRGTGAAPAAAMTDNAQTITAGNLDERLDAGRPRESQAARGHVRRSAGQARGVVRGPAPVRRQRLARAAHAADVRSHAPAGGARRSRRERRHAARGVRGAARVGARAGAADRGAADARDQRAGVARREPVDLAAVAARVTAAASDAGDRHGITVGTTLEPAVAYGDQALIERLVSNLVDNAIAYNVAGGRVEVRTSRGTGPACSSSPTPAW